MAFPSCLPGLPAPDFGKELKAPGERGRRFYSEDATLEGMQHHSWNVLGQAFLHLLTSPRGSQLPDFQQNSGWGKKDVLEHPEPEIHDIQNSSRSVAVQPRVRWHIRERGHTGPGAITCPQNAHFLQHSPIKQSLSPGSVHPVLRACRQVSARGGVFLLTSQGLQLPFN